MILAKILGNDRSSNNAMLGIIGADIEVGVIINHTDVVNTSLCSTAIKDEVANRAVIVRDTLSAASESVLGLRSASYQCSS